MRHLSIGCTTNNISDNGGGMVSWGLDTYKPIHRVQT